MAFNHIDIRVTGAQNHSKATQAYKTIVLKPNIVSNKNVLTQGMLSTRNIKYVIKWNYDLDEAVINVPKGCIISLEGGSLNNGTLLGQGTIFNESGKNSLLNVTLAGDWEIKVMGSANADEEDLTSADGILKLKDKAYNASVFSGLGRVYLKKNIQDVFTEGALFIYEEPTYGTKFLLQGHDGKFYVAYNTNDETALTVSEDNTEFEETSIQDIRILEGFADMTHFMGFTSELLQPETGESISRNDLDRELVDGYIMNYEDLYGTKNLLTQEMLSETNTIYHIQYDYVVNGHITMPDNCTLLFEGGSIRGMAPGFNFTGTNTLLAGDVNITRVSKPGTWRNAEPIAKIWEEIARLWDAIEGSEDTPQ